MQAIKVLLFIPDLKNVFFYIFAQKKCSLFKIVTFFIFKISVWLACRNLKLCEEKETACMVSVSEN